MFKKISIIGTGNVANWYYQTLLHNLNGDSEIQQVSARDLNPLFPDADLYILAVKDDVYESVISHIPFKMKIAVHTSGSLPIYLLEPKAYHFGTLYPFQTINFPKGTIYNPNLKVPICVEGDQGSTTQLLCDFAKLFSSMVFQINFEQRETIHLAAVFASNFTTIMYDIGFQILKTKNIDWNIMFPLLEETLNKTKSERPITCLTGPAKRGDFTIMDKHIKELNKTPFEEIYRLMSDYILQQELKH